MLDFTPMPTTVSLNTIYAPVQPQVDAARREVQDLWRKALALVVHEDVPVPDLGGKLLRPAMCLMSAGVSGADDLDSFVPMAASMEMLHMASLIHDDVVDHATLRRGDMALNIVWNNHTAVLGGDYLVARALDKLANYGSCAVFSNALESIRLMAEGELVNYGLGERYSAGDCIRLAEGKTASFFAVTCSTAAIVADDRYRQALYDYGMAFGVAFQLVDDIIDVTQPTATLGKPSCADIAEGKKTLPILHLRETLAGAERLRFESLLGCAVGDVDSAWIHEQMFSTGVYAKCVTEAQAFADRARKCLAALPDNEYREVLEKLTEFVLVRVS